MNDVERLIQELRWFGGRLTNRADVDFALRNPAGVTLGDLLAQSDETLAAVVPSGVCRKAVIEELLVVRYGRRLTTWFREFWCGRTHRAGSRSRGLHLMLRHGLDRLSPEGDVQLVPLRRRPAQVRFPGPPAAATGPDGGKPGEGRTRLDRSGDRGS